jgi:hypothetical protein
VNTPLDDTLNPKNGLNYAQFLEAILRVCMYKAEESKGSFKQILETLFKGSSKDEFGYKNQKKEFDMQYRAS